MALAAEHHRPLSFSNAAAQLKALQVDELSAVNDVILDHLQSQVPLIPEVATHLMQGGGKRLRPLLTLASAAVCGSQGLPAQQLAGAVELIHAATLLHDDVVDDSDLRRGLKTANIVFGNKESVLVGDFLFARAFELMVKTGSLQVLNILSHASCTISEGEVLQLETQADLSTPWEKYTDVIKAKTAALFAAATEAGAVVAGADEAVSAQLHQYGLHFGIAYQLVDDALDYISTDEALGKETGDDFREGKMTLPVILAYEKARDESEKAFWERTIRDRAQKDGDLAHAKALIARDGLIDEALNTAVSHAEQAVEALSGLPASPLLEALTDLAHASVVRHA